MNSSSDLNNLFHYLVGEFDNRAQALESPAWYVHLRLWLRPVPSLWSDSLVLFAEQANILNLEQPYRPRVLRLRENQEITVEHYMLRDIQKFQGAGSRPELLENLTLEDLHFLPGCIAIAIAVRTKIMVK